MGMEKGPRVLAILQFSCKVSREVRLLCSSKSKALYTSFLCDFSGGRWTRSAQSSYSMRIRRSPASVCVPYFSVRDDMNWPATSYTNSSRCTMTEKSAPRSTLHGHSRTLVSFHSSSKKAILNGQKDRSLTVTLPKIQKYFDFVSL